MRCRGALIIFSIFGLLMALSAMSNTPGTHPSPRMRATLHPQQQVVFEETTWGEHFIRSARILHEQARRPRFLAFSRSSPPQILSVHEELGGLWVSDVSGDHSRQILDEPVKYEGYNNINLYAGMRWSPDDKHLAYLEPPRSRENSGTLWVVRVKDTRRWQVQVNVSSGIKWDASGERVFFWTASRRNENHKRVWNLFEAHGPWEKPVISNVPQISLDENINSSPDAAMFSPDARDIAYWKQGVGLIVHSLDKGTSRTFNPFVESSIETSRNPTHIEWSADRTWIYLHVMPVNDIQA